MLIVAAKNMLIHVHHQKLGRHDITQLPLLAKDISSVAYNSLNDSLIVSDGELRRILAFNLRDLEVTQLQIGEVGRIVAMDFGMKTI